MTSRINLTRGFTLAELVVVGALIGVILLLCWPSMRGMSKGLIEKAAADRADLELRERRERGMFVGAANHD